MLPILLRLLPATFFIIFTFPLHAQTLSLFDIDTSAYPNVRAKFYAMEKGKQIITLTKDDVGITENGIVQTVVKVSNPALVKAQALSIVLTVDVSGSMSGENIELAKLATKTFVEMMPFDISECAITSFDDDNYLNADFTNNPSTLKAAIDQLKPNGGTDYNAGFIRPMTGAIDIGKIGRNKKVLIFLTDGLGDANESEIIGKAQKEGITVYCVTVGMPAPLVLQNVATKTGGKYFENISDRSKAVEIYQTILHIAQGSEPSTIEWLSAPTCDQYKKLEFTVPAKAMKQTNLNYWAAINGVIRLAAKPQGVKYKNIKAGGPNDTTITLAAYNKDITILSAASNNPAFSIVNTTFPLLVKSGKEQKIILRYEAKDSIFQTARIELKNNVCAPLIIYANSGLHGKNARVPLKVVSPNGGEVFYAGSDTVITWSGVIPSDKVSLQFSKDNGKSWDKLSSNATDNKFKWKLPFITGNEMLVKATYGSPAKDGGNSKAEMLFDKTIDIYSGFIKISPDNSRMISVNESYIVVMELATGNVLQTLAKVGDFLFSEDGNQIYLYKTGEYTNVFDPVTFKKVGELPPFKSVAQFSRNNKLYASASGNHIEIYEVVTGKLLNSIDITNGYKVSDLTENLLTAVMDNSPAEVWDLHSKTKIASFATPQPYVAKALLSGDEQYLSVWSWASSGKPHIVSVFDLSAKTKLYEIVSLNDRWRGMEVGENVLLCPLDDKPTLIELSTGKVLKVIEGDFYSGKMSPDGTYALVGHYSTNRFAVYSTGYTGANKVLGEDVSDQTFSIVNPTITSKDIKLGKVMIGESKDSVITSFISNKNKCKVDIKEIKIIGADASAFSLISGFAPVMMKANSFKNVEFRFKPSKVGTHIAQVSLITGFDTITQNISGEGLEKTYSLSKELINMGKTVLGTVKDSTILAVLKNTGSSPLIISKVENAGPDKTQFILSDVSVFMLKPGESKNIKISFKPTQLGRTGTNILFKINGLHANTDVPVFAEGIKEEKKEPVVIVFGKVLDKTSKAPLEAMITYHDLNSDAASVTAKSNPDGTYRIILPYGKSYGLLAEKIGHIAENTNIDLSQITESKNIERDLLLAPLEVGSTVNLNNVFFERGKAILLEGSYKELDKLVKLLNDNPTLKIELAGHTDNLGDPKKDVILSEERVDVIMKYLIEKGISSKRLTGKGYGGSKPIASNATEETRKLNRRVEFKIVGK